MQMAENTDRISLTPLSQVWFSLRQCSWNSRLLNGIVWTNPAPNLIQIAYEIGKTRKSIYALKYSTTVTESIFMKFMFLDDFL
jgi:hypothetical protein